MPRLDHRLNDQLRPVKFTPHFTAYAEGSVLIETGNTRVLCNATIEDKVPSWREESGGGWLTAEYAMLPRSTHRRISRRQGSEDARSQEIRRLIGRALRAVVDVDKLGARTLTLDCDVIQADGGTRTASITGGYVAVAIALQKLIKAYQVPASVLITPVAAVSVGVVGSELLLDLCYEEDSAAEVDFNMVMTGAGKFVEIQGTAEKTPFDQETLLGLVALARQGIEQLLAQQAELLTRL
ncbi:MAG: ribonuclease PH [Chloroflexota bacterium]|nr:MAG: ribonuclease PH [Chloroflexota bacterium]